MGRYDSFSIIEVMWAVAP